MHCYCRACLVLSIFLLTACGGGGSGADKDSSTSVNRAPVFSATSSVEILEGQELSLNLSFSDPEGRPVTTSITGGADKGKFAISLSGILSFVVLPDYENPTDQGTDNNYNFQLQWRRYRS